MEAHVTLETEWVEETANEIRDRLLGFNQERVGPFNWNGLFIDLLWVDEPARRRGIGSALMQCMPRGHSRTWFAKWLK